MTDKKRRQEAFVRRNRVARQQLLQATFRPDENVDDGPVTNFGKALDHDEGQRSGPQQPVPWYHSRRTEGSAYLAVSLERHSARSDPAEPADPGVDGRGHGHS